MKKIFSFCRCYLYMNKWRLFFYVIISVVASLATLISPYIMGNFIDQLIAANNINFIFWYLGVFSAK